MQNLFLTPPPKGNFITLEKVAVISYLKSFLRMQIKYESVSFCFMSLFLRFYYYECDFSIFYNSGDQDLSEQFFE